VNVLLTCVGLRVDNVTAFRDALHARGEGGLVVGTDADPMAPAVHFCDRWEQVPPASDPRYVDHLVALVERHEIAVVVPCSEWDLEELADGRERLEAAGATVFISDPGPTRTCVDKYRMHEFLVARSIPSPRTVDPATAARRPPLPRAGQDATGARLGAHLPLRDARGGGVLPRLLARVVDGAGAVPGREFSIDLLCDLDGRCLNAIPRLMQGKKGGEQIKGTTIEDAELMRSRGSWPRPCRCGAPGRCSASASRPDDTRSPTSTRGSAACSRCRWRRAATIRA
jgi:carbamoyl-phosphate synthase large subunit